MVSARCTVVEVRLALLSQQFTPQTSKTPLPNASAEGNGDQLSWGGDARHYRPGDFAYPDSVESRPDWPRAGGFIVADQHSVAKARMVDLALWVARHAADRLPSDWLRLRRAAKVEYLAKRLLR